MYMDNILREKKKKKIAWVGKIIYRRTLRT